MKEDEGEPARGADEPPAGIEGERAEHEAMPVTVGPDAAAPRAAFLRPRDFLVALAMLVSTVVSYLPFRGHLEVGRYWDGPLYLYIAETLYKIPDPTAFEEYQLPPAYFACHLPLYPLLIRAVAFLPVGWNQAMLAATALSAMAAAVLFLRLLEAWSLVKSPVDTALLFCVFPPRWLLYHSVGATEPLFLALVFAAFLAYARDRPALVALATGLACLTRINGLLLLPAFGLAYLFRGRFRAAVIVALAVVCPLGLGFLHFVLYGDALAYFHWNVGRERLVSTELFSVFRAYAYTEDFHAAEYYYFTYVIHAIGLMGLFRRRVLFFYGLLMFALSTTIFHVDLGRYMLALSPFALLIGLDPVIGGRRARLLLPLAAYLGYHYVWGYVPHNLVTPLTWERVLDAGR